MEQVYRHPSCLIKHRWEHTPQWREASKFVLSKHQQVQLLEVGLLSTHATRIYDGTFDAGSCDPIPFITLICIFARRPLPLAVFSIRRTCPAACIQ